MPVSYSSPARNLFLLGTTGQDVVTNFFDKIDRSTSGYFTYVPAEVIKNTVDEEILIGLNADEVSPAQRNFGIVEKRLENGTQEWENFISATNPSGQAYLRDIHLDSNNNIIACGHADGVPFVVKYDNDGVIDWQSTTNSGDVEYYSVTSDSNGNYYACGNTPETGEAQAFVESFDANGNPGWGKSAFMLGRDVTLTSIAANSRGHVVAVGYLEDDSADKAYIIKIDTNTGEVLWDRTLETNVDVRATAVVIDDSDDIYIAANYGTENVDTNGSVLKYTAEGNLLWQSSTNVSDSSINYVVFSDIAVDNSSKKASVIGYTSVGAIVISRYESDGRLSWRREAYQVISGYQSAFIDVDQSFTYFLFDDAFNQYDYTFGKVSATGNGLGDFEYSNGDGSGIPVQYVPTTSQNGSNITEKIGRLSDGSVRNDSSDLLTYPFNANNILFDDLATQVTNKRRQMDSADSFEYSGSPAIRPTDFTDLSYTTDTIQVQTTGQEKLYTTVGQYSFVVPSGVTEVSAVCVGGGGGASGTNGGPNSTAGAQLAGGGGGGGGLAYGTFAVTPGEVLTVVVGDGGQGTAGGVDANDGEDSTISRGATVLLNGGGGGGGLAPPDTSATAPTNQANTGGVGGTSTGTERDGGGTGGTGGNASKNLAGGAGGGAAGYSGNGGTGAYGNNNTGVTSGSGGGGSGGTTNVGNCGGGGGVGVINGEGASGSVPPVTGTGGNGGSFGGAGFVGNGVSHGGLYGGGGGSDDDDVVFDGGDGAQGAVRIIWGIGRAFPSTLTLPNAGVSFIPAVEDKSNKGRTGEIEGISANANGYWEFTGTDNTFIATQKCNEIFEDGGSGTIEMWVRMNDVTTRQTLCSGYLSFGPTQPDRWDFEVSGGVLRGGSHDNNFFAGSTTLSTATWYHFVFTLDKSSGNGTLKAYVNGVEDVSQVFTLSRDWATDVQFCIGNRYLQSSDFPLNADVGEVRCYRRALNSTQIFQNYNATKSKYINEAPDIAPKIGPGIVYDNNLLLNYDFGNRATYDSAENLLLNSNDLSSSDWEIGGSQGLPTRTQDALSPVGDLTAWTVDDTATGADGEGMDSNVSGLTASSTQTYTMSVYAKKGTAAKFDMYCFFKPTIRGTRLSYTWDTNQIFTNGSDNGGAAPVSSGQEYVGNGWYRIWMEVIDSTLGTNTELEFRLYPASRDTGPTGSTLFWNPQVVKGSNPGRPIKTYGTAITAPTTVKNLSSSSYAGTINGGATFNSAGYMEFDGVDDRLSNFDVLLSQTNGWTCELWFRAPDAVNQNTSGQWNYLFRDAEAGGPFWECGMYSNGYTFTMKDNTIPSNQTAVEFSLTQNQWHYIAFGLTSTGETFLTGSDASGNLSTDLPGVAATSGACRVVNLFSNDLGGGFLPGHCGEIRLYDKELTLAERTQNFNATRGKYGV